MFPAAVIRKLARSEEMFAQSQTYFGATVLLSGPVDIDAMSAAFEALLQAHPVLAGHLDRGPDGLHQIVADDYQHPGLWVTGGPGRPEGLNRGYFVRPTVFANVTNQMTIAREEIFGPVLSIIPFETEEEAVQIANDTPYGLTDYVQTQDAGKASRVARRLRAGMVEMNGQPRGAGAPFGGYKMSGNGREGGHWGLEDFLEVKAVSGWAAE